MKQAIWVTVAIVTIAILFWFCWLVWQFSELVTCSNMPFDELTAHCAEIMK